MVSAIRWYNRLKRRDNWGLQRSPFDVDLAVVRCLFGRLAILARDNVSRIPVRPVMLRCRSFIFTVVFLRLLQKPGQGSNIQTPEPSARQPRCDFLDQPSIAVGITKRGERAVGAVFRCRSNNATAAVDLELSAWRSGVEHLTHRDTACANILLRCLDIGDDQLQALG